MFTSNIGAGNPGLSGNWLQLSLFVVSIARIFGIILILYLNVKVY